MWTKSRFERSQYIWPREFVLRQNNQESMKGLGTFSWLLTITNWRNSLTTWCSPSTNMYAVQMSHNRIETSKIRMRKEQSCNRRVLVDYVQSLLQAFRSTCILLRHRWCLHPPQRWAQSEIRWGRTRLSLTAICTRQYEISCQKYFRNCRDWNECSVRHSATHLCDPFVKEARLLF